MVTTGDIIERPYINHIWTYASAKVINRNVCKLPKVIINKDDPEQKETQHEVLDLFDDPNPWMSSISFWQAIILGLLLPPGIDVQYESTIIPRHDRRRN